MIESVLFINPDMVNFSLSPSGVSTAMESPIATPIICFTFSVTNASLLACGKRHLQVVQPRFRLYSFHYNRISLLFSS